MKITAEALAQALPILEKIKAIDSRIAELDKFAKMAIDGKVKFKHALTYIEKPKKKKRKSFLEHPDPWINGPHPPMMGRVMFGGTYMGMGKVVIDDMEKEKENDKEIVFDFNISETATLQILGCMLGEYQRQRHELIETIKALDIEL